MTIRPATLVTALAAVALAPAALAGTGSEVKLIDAQGHAGSFFGGGIGSIMDVGGQGVAVAGDVAVVASMLDGVGGTWPGTATVFRRDGDAWVAEQELSASGATQGELFGSSVAIDQDVIVVGACAAYQQPWGPGSATVFRHDGTLWVEEQRLLASDGEDADLFGNSVAVCDDVIVVGAALDTVAGAFVQGSATVFRRVGGAWIEEQLLVASDGEAYDGFGSSVSISGDVIVVGAAQDDSLDGSATVFRWDGSAWVEEQRLRPSFGEDQDHFGTSVQVDGDVIVVGTPWDQGSTAEYVGSASVFRWDGSTWVAEQRLSPPDGESLDNYGWSVAVSGPVIVVGSARDTVQGQDNQGSAWLYRWDGATWVEEQQIVSSDGVWGDRFGGSVAVDADSVIVGAHLCDIDGNGAQGAAYVYDVTPSAWSDQGGALAGATGDPRLAGSGTLAAGSLNRAELCDAAPASLAGLFLALSSSPVPFKGGTLLPFPFLPPVLLSTDPGGAISLPFVMPAGAPTGTELWVQWAIQDGGAVAGVALSNAILGITP